MTRQFKTSPLCVAAPTSPLQKLLFSATMTQNPEHLATLNLHQPKLFTVASALQSKGRGCNLDTAFTLPKQLEQRTVKCSLEHKPLVLLQLLTSNEKSAAEDSMKRVLCFTNSKESTHRCVVACMDAVNRIRPIDTCTSMHQVVGHRVGSNPRLYLCFFVLFPLVLKLTILHVTLYTNVKSLFRLYLLLDAFKLVSVGEISSSLGQGKRKMILNNFKDGKIQVRSNFNLMKCDQRRNIITMSYY